MPHVKIVKICMESPWTSLSPLITIRNHVNVNLGNLNNALGVNKAKVIARQNAIIPMSPGQLEKGLTHVTTLNARMRVDRLRPKGA